MRTQLAAVVALAMISAAPAPMTDDESTYLLTSDDVSQLDLVGFGPETITIKDKEIRLSGKPNGYFATKESYKNYVLKFEWKYEKPERLAADAKFDGNSGVLIHIEGDHKVWPKCVEAQLAYAEAGHVFAINGAKFDGKTDRAALKKSIKPVGEWNDVEIVSNNGEISVKVNGFAIASGSGASPNQGTIGFQSEGSPICFRYLRIKQIP